LKDFASTAGILRKAGLAAILSSIGVILSEAKDLQLGPKANQGRFFASLSVTAGSSFRDFFMGYRSASWRL
jgi:hypothetical protein